MEIEFKNLLEESEYNQLMEHYNKKAHLFGKRTTILTRLPLNFEITVPL